MAPARLNDKDSWPPNVQYEDWLGMPCVASVDYDGGLQNTIQVKKGARGFVGQILEEIKPTISLSGLTLSDDDPPFIKNSAALFQAVLDERSNMRFVPEAAFTYISRHTPLKLARVAAELIQKSAPKLMAILNSGRPFTVEEVRQACPLLRSTDNVGGIYLRYYDPDATGSKAIYIGQSVHMTARQVDHEKDIKDLKKKTYHYAQVRNAKTREARLVCKTEDRILLDIIEQLMISLLECYTPYVKQRTSSGIEVPIAQDPIANDPTRRPFGMMEDEDFVERDSVVQSRFFTHIFNRVKARTGWHGCCDSSHFGARGLNHQSPLTRFAMAEQMFWTKMDLSEPGVTQYRRPPQRVQSHPNAAGVMQHDVDVVANAFQRTPIPGFKPEELTAKASTLSITWNADEAGPPAGAQCVVCVEIMHDEKQHPYRWSGLPTVGPWENWKRANALAIRLEWEAGGQHYCCYYQSFIQHDMIKDENQKNSVGAVRPYANAEGLRRYLEQETIVNPEYWYTNYGRSRVKEVKFDWLRQAWIFTDLTPPRPIPRESLKTKEVIFNELRQAGFPAEDIGRKFGTIRRRPNPPPYTRWERGTCDRCSVAGTDTASVKTIPAGTPNRMQKASRVLDQCAQWPADDPNSVACQHCFDFGMVCTWTPTYELWDKQNITRLNAISFAPRTTKTRKIHPTPDPRTSHQKDQKPVLP
ncbi:hypothetical protein KCU78_g4429, partial [Aureobasidium melanogenum]